MSRLENCLLKVFCGFQKWFYLSQYFKYSNYLFNQIFKAQPSYDVMPSSRNSTSVQTQICNLFCHFSVSKKLHILSQIFPDNKKEIFKILVFRQKRFQEFSMFFLLFTPGASLFNKIYSFAAALGMAKFIRIIAVNFDPTLFFCKSDLNIQQTHHWHLRSEVSVFNNRC